MPIHQPVQTTILASDFQDKAYCFPVESVILPQERSGLLTVSASPGYLLTTSFTDELKREQTVKHTRQTDGSWFVKGTVTVRLTGDSVVDGTIIIRNSDNETLVLTIDSKATSLVQVRKAEFSVSHSALTFPPTSPDKPSFLVLTIAQPQANVPITLTTDAPEYFQLASDSRPAFLPTLTLTPSAIGSYIHIRYAADKHGRHAGVLTVQNLYEKRTVTLEGRSSGFLPVFKRAALPVPNQPVVAKRWMKALALTAVVGGLAYAGYANRCQLVPALCQESDISQVSTQVTDPLPALSPSHSAPEKVAISSVVAKATKRIKPKEEKQDPISREPDQNRMVLSEPAVTQTTSDNPNQEVSSEVAELPSASQKKPYTQRRAYSNQPERQKPQQTAPARTADESELERMLNQKP